LKASPGQSLASASANAGNGKLPKAKPARLPATAPFRMVRRAAFGASRNSFIALSPLLFRTRSARVEEIDDSFDFLVGQNEVALEGRHDGERIALGLVGNDGDQFLAVRKTRLHVG